MQTEHIAATYEKLYYAMWELSQRYREFTQFRVIGKTHDDRLLPMIEVGRGNTALFCISGLSGKNRRMPCLLLQMIREYCQCAESNWLLEDFYEVRALLDQIRICFMPLSNPDGYMIVQNGFGAIRNPIYRQMLRMQDTPSQIFAGNGRGIVLNENFPTDYYRRTHPGEEPSSENETKALIRILQEYESRGLMEFQEGEQSMISIHAVHHRYRLQNRRIAKHLKHVSRYQLVRQRCEHRECASLEGSMGTMVQFYADRMKQPAFQIHVRIPVQSAQEDIGCPADIYREIHRLPLEFLFSVLEA